MTNAEFDREQRKDRIFYALVGVFVAAWLGYCLYDVQVRHSAAAGCKARGGYYLNVGFEKYGCFKLVPV